MLRKGRKSVPGTRSRWMKRAGRAQHLEGWLGKYWEKSRKDVQDLTGAEIHVTWG